MHALDLNLLVALDALLREGSVVGAARRVGLSAPAMSRTLGRVRDAMGDPILVRAGRGLVPTPRAEAVRERVRALVDEAEAVMRGGGALDLATLERTFTIRASDVAAAFLAGALAAPVAAEAPRVRLRFAPEGDEDAEPLRDGRIDLDVSAMGMEGPELRVQLLARATFVGVVREGHALARGKVTPARFARASHVSVSRRGRAHGPIDDALAALGLGRTVSVVLASHLAALAVVETSDLVAAMPRWLVAGRAVRTFPLPVAVPAASVAQAWHPRLDVDPAHRWLRGLVREAFRAGNGPGSRAPGA